MKKFLTALLLFSLVTFMASAQNGETRFRLGLKAAPSFAWLKPDADGLSAGAVAMKFSYGLITEFGIGKNYAFATGVDVSYVGGNLNFGKKVFEQTSAGDTFMLASRKYKLQYIEIPLTLKMKTNQIGYMTYFLQFGLNPSIRIKAKADDKDQAGVALNNVDISGDISLFRLALNVGIGAEYNIHGNTSLVFGITFNNGFTNVLTNPSNTIQKVSGGSATAYIQKATSNYLALTVGVLF